MIFPIGALLPNEEHPPAAQQLSPPYIPKEPVKKHQHLASRQAIAGELSTAMLFSERERGDVEYRAG